MDKLTPLWWVHMKRNFWTRDMLVDQGGKKLHYFWILLAQGIICLLNIFYNFEFEIT